MAWQYLERGPAIVKICLLNPPQNFLKDPTAYPPLGLLYLASSARLRGYTDLSLCNLATMGDTNEVFPIPPADIYGISATTATWRLAKRLALFIRRQYPDAIIIMGGIHPTIFAEKIVDEKKPFYGKPLKDEICDFVVKGYGEYSFPRLLKEIENVSPAGISRIWQRNVLDLDFLPFPARDLVPKEILQDRSMIFMPENHSLNGYATTLITSRGCPFSCAFCTKIPMTSEVIYRSAGNILSEIRELIQNYGISQFRVVDDLFTVNRRRIEELARLKGDTEMYLSTILRADMLDEEIVKTMYKAGVRVCSIGVESGSEEILRTTNKRESIADIEKAIKLCKDIGIHIKVFLIFGLPGENARTIDKTMRFMERNKPDGFTLSTFIPLPGSDIYNHPEKYGVEFIEHPESTDFRDYHFYYEPEDDRGFHLRYDNLDELKKGRSELIRFLRSGSWR